MREIFQGVGGVLERVLESVLEKNLIIDDVIVCGAGGSLNGSVGL